MPFLASWIEVPRGDLDAHGTYRFSAAFQVSFGASTLVVLAVTVGMVWAAHTADAEHPGALQAVALVFSVLSAYCLRVVSTLWDRVETTPDELRYRGLFGGVRAVPWSRIESIRGRNALKRVEVRASALARPIRLELQLDRIDVLLMVIAERTHHLLDTRPAAAPVPVQPGGLGAPGGWRSRNRITQWSIEPDGLVLGNVRAGFGDVADLRIASVGSPLQGQLVAVALLRDGSALVLHVGADGLAELYQRARRAQRGWYARSGAVPPAPVPLAQQPAAFGRRTLALLASLGLAAVIGIVTAAARDPDAIARLWRGGDTAAIERGAALFQQHRHEEVVALAEEHFAAHAASQDNLVLLHLQALSYRKLGRTDDAIAAYERALPIVRQLDTVHAEPWGVLLYEVSALYHQRGDTRAAIDALEEGLQLRPRSVTHRALLAAWYQDRSDPHADRLFREVLDGAPRGSEAYAVAERRLRLASEETSSGDRSSTRPRVELASGLAVAIVPFEPVDPRLDLGDICLVLEASLWIPCSVLPVQPIAIDRMLDAERNQIDGSRVLPLLQASLPKIAARLRAPEAGLHLLGVTSGDMFGGTARFVFAWSHPEGRVAVMSTHRLLEELPAYWPAEALAGRRISIQAVSAVGLLLGLPRPVSHHCPLAYPNGIEEFLLERGELCDSTVEARDALLAARGGPRRPHDEERAQAVERVYRELLLD